MAWPCFMSKALFLLLFCCTANAQVFSSGVVRGGVFWGGLSTRAAADAGNDFTADMIACWPLTEATGTREDDWASFDLADNNTVTGTTGPVGLGDASSFASANSEYLSHADHASLRMGDFDTTFAVWANLTADASGLFRCVFSKDDSEGSRGYVLNYIESTDKFHFDVLDTGAGSATAISSGTYAPASGWHFIVCGFNSTTDDVFISVDDSALDTDSMALPPNPGTAEFRIGARVSVGIPSYWEGGIAGVAMWDRLLTAGEITTLYAAGAGARACEEQGN